VLEFPDGSLLVVDDRFLDRGGVLTGRIKEPEEVDCLFLRRREVAKLKFERIPFEVLYQGVPALPWK